MAEEAHDVDGVVNLDHRCPPRLPQPGPGLHQDIHVAPDPISRASTDRQHHRLDHKLNDSNADNFVSRIPSHDNTTMSTTNGDEERDGSRMKCCCGRPDCAYLEHNNAALGGLERDLETAARLGQTTKVNHGRASMDQLQCLGHADGIHSNMTSDCEAPPRKRYSWIGDENCQDGGLTFALQALLSRHESYISESHAERERLSTCITDLECERYSLQSANEKIVAENRDLLQQLERLNGSLAESDRDVKRLESLLLDCELEVKRLNSLVRRTEELDGRVQEMEQERQQLSNQMEDGREQTRSTLSRWRESERRVRELEEDVRRIEWEARMDREKHEEIVARLEKERALERELGNAEGRLKGATAVQSIGNNANSNKKVVSHFVRDILQDNANLQAGIAELRQLLQTSNEEVQNLREQVLQHQPVLDNEQKDTLRASMSLDQELPPDPPSPKQQREVHVHHHYHAKPAKNKPPAARRSGRRKAIMSSHGNLSDSSVPSTPLVRPYRYSSSPVVPLSLHQPPPPPPQQSQHQRNRWSMQSTATVSTVLSSIPSSPRSYFDRGAYIFDRIEQGEESSRPTSPESVGDSSSPGPGLWKIKEDRDSSHAHEGEQDQSETFGMSPVVQHRQLPAVIPPPESRQETEQAQVERQLTPKPSVVLQSPTDEEVEATKASSMDAVGEDVSTETEPARETGSKSKDKQPLRESNAEMLGHASEIRPTLTRKGSHETLVSISGMDIHIAQRASPTTTLELLHRHFAHSPSQSRKISAAQPQSSVTEYTVVTTPAHMSNGTPNRTLRHMPSSIEALSGIAVPKPRTSRTTSQNGAIGRFGGWVRDKWGVAPTRSSSNLRTGSREHDAMSITSSTSGSSSMPPRTEDSHSDAASNMTEEGVSIGRRSIDVKAANPLHAKVDPAILFAGRSPGVNQSGFIPGFRAAVMNKRTPSQVMASVIDEEGLREGLAG